MWFTGATAPNMGSSDATSGWQPPSGLPGENADVGWPVGYFPVQHPTSDKGPSCGMPMGAGIRSGGEAGIEEDNSIDLLLSQLLSISKKSPSVTNSGSLESINGKQDQPIHEAHMMHSASQLHPTYQELMKANCSDLWADISTYQDSNNPGEQCSELTAEEEAAICALVPKLVKVSMSKSVRGVYLDRRRGLWRANWREGGKVKTKGFRIAQWGEHEARRKAVEVRKLMETRGCFLKLKAVAMGDPQRILSDPDLYNSPIFQPPQNKSAMPKELYYSQAWPPAPPQGDEFSAEGSSSLLSREQGHEHPSRASPSAQEGRMHPFLKSV